MKDYSIVSVIAKREEEKLIKKKGEKRGKRRAFILFTKEVKAQESECELEFDGGVFMCLCHVGL